MPRAKRHGLGKEMKRALRLASALYENAENISPIDRLYLRRMTARDGWGRPTRMLVRQAFYIRSHWIRMPPTMLTRHLWTKWRKGAADRGGA
jgi:hypothetical protein